MCVGFTSNFRLVAVSGFFDASNTGGEEGPASAWFGFEMGDNVAGSGLFSDGNLLEAASALAAVSGLAFSSCSLWLLAL